MVLSVYWEHVKKLERSPERAALERIASLYGANLLHLHVALLYEVNTPLIERKKQFMQNQINKKKMRHPIL